MEELRIEYWPVRRLTPYSETLRPSGPHVDRMIAAIREYGLRGVLLVDEEGEIIDGHLRLKAAVALGMETVPVLVVRDLEPDQIRALRLLINESARWVKWNEQELLEEIKKLVAVDYDLSSIGFLDNDLDELLLQLDGANKVDVDDVPDAPDASRVRSGDLWHLGQHRLLCADSTSAESMSRLMQEEQADMIWTDPPYNVNYSGKAGKIKNDKMGAQQFETFLSAAHAAMYSALTPGGGIYVAHAETGDATVFRRVFTAAGFRLASCLVWRKQSAVLSRGDYHYQHEPILYGWKPAPSGSGGHRWYGNRKQKSVLDFGESVTAMPDGSYQLFIGGRLYALRGQGIELEEIPTTVISEPRPSRSDLHPTTKPVRLIERMLVNSSPRGGVVLDPFGGSGSTLMACEKSSRACRTLELDPRFAEVIISRWQGVTGQTATRDVDGARLTDLEPQESAHVC